MLPVLLVGYGLIGPLWARLLMDHPRLTLCAIVDTSHHALRRAARELGLAHLNLTTDMDAAVRACAPAAIVDASPPWNHANTARVARAAQCHLLSEKPLATDFREAARQIQEWH